MEKDQGAPYAGLTPDTVLNAVDSAGLVTDGRQLALNSYENRVFQVGLDDGRFVVVKFYRPGRWTDEQILEEHAFTAELAELEVPAVPALVLDGRTLHAYEGFRFTVFPRSGGRAPNLDDPGVREWLGRFLGRIHAVGAVRPFAHRPALDAETFGVEPRRFLIDHAWLPRELAGVYDGVSQQALDGVARCYERAGDVKVLRLHGDCHEGNVLWTDSPGNTGPHFVDFDDSRTGPAVQDLWMLLGADRDEQTERLSDMLLGLRGLRRVRPARAPPGRGPANAAAACTTPPGSRGAGTIRRSRPRSPGSTRSATGRSGSSNCASRSPRCRSRRSSRRTGGRERARCVHGARGTAWVRGAPLTSRKPPRGIAASLHCKRYNSSSSVAAGRTRGPVPHERSHVAAGAPSRVACPRTARSPAGDSVQLHVVLRSRDRDPAAGRGRLARARRTARRAPHRPQRADAVRGARRHLGRPAQSVPAGRPARQPEAPRRADRGAAPPPGRDREAAPARGRRARRQGRPAARRRAQGRAGIRGRVPRHLGPAQEGAPRPRPPHAATTTSASTASRACRT